MMISRRLWNSHQRHKFLRAEASRDILKFRVSEVVFPEVFSTVDAMCFVRIHVRLGTMPSFHNVARFEHFTDLNLFKYAFNVIQIWEMDTLQFYSMVRIFC